MKLTHQVRAFKQVLESYDGKVPLHRFLNTYFKAHKQMGSSDRRWASRYIYSYFRLGQALSQEPESLRLAIGDFLCHQTPSLIVEAELPMLLPYLEATVTEKIGTIKQAYPGFQLTDIFPFSDRLSDSINPSDFYVSFFTQPDLFIRVNASFPSGLKNVLEENEVPFTSISERTIALPNGTKLEQLLPESNAFHIQDLSSQSTGKFFRPQRWDYWWDCCAASGGKSLLLHGLEPEIQLLVSDLRENSLHNLDERFAAAGIKKYQKKVLDLLKNNEQDLHHYEFDGIILDAPCTGSGTWGRTPEMLTFFNPVRIPYFSKLQKGIAANVVKYLKPGKPLIYITCSVFREENEEVVNWMLSELPVKLESMEVIKGYDKKADTMFAARLIKL